MYRKCATERDGDVGADETFRYPAGVGGNTSGDVNGEDGGSIPLSSGKDLLCFFGERSARTESGNCINDDGLFNDVCKRAVGVGKEFFQRVEASAGGCECFGGAVVRMILGCECGDSPPFEA